MRSFSNLNHLINAKALNSMTCMRSWKPMAVVKNTVMHIFWLLVRHLVDFNSLVVRKRDTNMVLDLWLGGQTYNPVIKMLKKRSLAQYVKKYKLSTTWYTIFNGRQHSADHPILLKISWRPQFRWSKAWIFNIFSQRTLSTRYLFNPVITQY